MREDGQFDSHESHIIVATSRKVAYGVGSAGMNLTESLVNSFVLTFYPVILKANPALIGAVLFAPRVFDAVTDPIFGQISDRTRSRWGRRRPYLLFGAPLLGLFTWLMFTPPSGASQTTLAAYVLIVGMLYYAVYAVVYVAYTALGAELSIDYHERTRVQAWRTAMYFIGSLLGGLTWKLAQLDVFPNERVGVMWVTGVFAVFVTVSVWYTFWGTREEKELQGRGSLSVRSAFAATLSNKPFLVLSIVVFVLLIQLFGGFSLMNYVNIYYVCGGDHDKASSYVALSSICLFPGALLGALFWAWMAIQFGKRESLVLTLGFLAVLAPLTWVLFTPRHPALQLVCQFLMGFTTGSLNVIPNTMVADICDVDEFTTGYRREGAYNGILALMIKGGFAGTFFVTGLLLKLSGFQEALDIQTPETITRMRILLVVVPLVLGMIIVVVSRFYSLQEATVRQIRNVLEQRRAALPDHEHQE